MGPAGSADPVCRVVPGISSNNSLFKRRFKGSNGGDHGGSSFAGQEAQGTGGRMTPRGLRGYPEESHGAVSSAKLVPIFFRKCQCVRSGVLPQVRSQEFYGSRGGSIPENRLSFRERLPAQRRPPGALLPEMDHEKGNHHVRTVASPPESPLALSPINRPLTR